MRTRTRTTPVLIPAGFRRQVEINPVTGLVTFDATITNSVDYPVVLDCIETIIDEEQKMKRYGNCQHSRTSTVLIDNEFTEHYETHGPERVCTRQYSGGYWLWLRFRTLVNSWLTPTVPIVSNVDEIDWASYSFEAMSNMKPSFADSFSLGNDLLELHQIRELIHPQGHGYASKSRIIRPSLFNRLSSIVLWNDYGLQPLISSAKSVLKLLASLPEKIRKIREQRGKVQTRHYSCFIRTASVIPDIEEVFSDTSDVGFKAFREVEFKRPPRYHASLRFQYDVDSLSDLELTVRAALEGTGLSNPASIAWNAIPFSFIVDWFIDVDKWITSVLSEPVIPIIVLDFCHSVEYEYRTSVYGEEQSNPILRMLAAYRDVRFYERRRAIPNTVAPLGIKWPTLGNIIDGVALLGTRDPGLRAPRGQRRLPSLNFGKVRANQIR